VGFKTTAIDHSAIPPQRHSGPNLFSIQGLQADAAAMCHRKCGDREGIARRVKGFILEEACHRLPEGTMTLAGGGRWRPWQSRAAVFSP
jgi:hypothetical protein